MERTKRFVYLWVGSLLLVSSAAAQQLSPEVIHYPEIVIYNGKILTADEKFTIAQAVAIRDGKFLAVGTTDRIMAMAGPHTRKIDLQGKTAMPGLIDTHYHPFTAGMQAYWLKKWLGETMESGTTATWNGTELLDALSAWHSNAAALGDIRKAVSRAKPGEVIVLPRVRIEPERAESGRQGLICQVPLAEIDAASPNNPILFAGTVNLTVLAMNSAAAKSGLLKLPPGTNPFVKEGGPCITRGYTVDGVLPPAVQAVNDYLYWATPLEDQMPAYRDAVKAANSIGITLAKEHTVLPLITGIRELWARGELNLRLRMPYPLTPNSGQTVEVPPEEAETLFRRIGNMSGIGDDVLRFFGLRPPAVGGNLWGGSVWTIEAKKRPFGDTFGNAAPYGGWEAEQNAQGKETFRGREALIEAVRFGWNVSADHTVGDRAVHEVVMAMEEGLRTQVVHSYDQKLSINHTPMARLEDMREMKKLGIAVSIGAYHVFEKRNLEAGLIAYGTEQVNSMMPMETYIKLGMKPTLENDTEGYPPFWRFEKAIDRKDDAYHKAWNSSEGVTRQQAVWMTTSWGAYQLGEEKKLGTIEPGKLADLIVIDKDYMNMPADQIHTIKVLLTIMGAKVVYERGAESK